MVHTSLYRKYRPATFDDVVGQQHIERTLRNAVADGRTAHAYLFTGPRGTGKTTTARLLAKALLCERGPTDEPDGTCEQCIDISEGRHPDVFELDAASRTGVENVREEIIGRVQFAPSRGKYKLYIIDEVHMLSNSAFNALLKTLEEPPPHVVFVMCTTHPHKVPETIHSRCQQFDFRRISVEEIADRLRFIAESEGFKVDRGAFTLMARHAEGGMRDAITALEQLASFTGGEVTIDDVEGLLGEVDSAQLFEVASLVARRDIAGCFRWVAATAETGTDLAELVSELTAHVRDLYVIAAVGDASGIVDRTVDEMTLLQTQAVEFGGPDRLARVLDLLGELGSEMRWSSDPRLSLEVALTRMARPQGEMTIEALAERVEAIELGTPVPRGSVIATPAAAPAPAPVPAPAVAPAAPAAPAPEVATPAPAAQAPADSPEPTPAPQAEAPCLEIGTGGVIDRAAAKRGWQATLAEIKQMKPARYQTFASIEVDVDADGSTLVLEFPSDQKLSVEMASDPDNRELVRVALTKVFGFSPGFRYQLGRGAVRPADDDATFEPAFSAPQPAPSVPTVNELDPSDPVSDVLTDDASAEVVGVSDAGARARSGGDDLEDMLINQLGAKIVAEHPAQPNGEDDQ